ncbi:hypothetical protein STEG23_027575 [Scotinomys teguina]
MPFNRRMDKENVVHIHNGVLRSRENNDIMKFAGKWMELENVILSEPAGQDVELSATSPALVSCHASHYAPAMTNMDYTSECNFHYAISTIHQPKHYNPVTDADKHKSYGY